jgi:subtilase family serine protease
LPAIDPWVTAAGGTTTAIGANGKVLADYPFGETADRATDDGTGYQEPLPGEFWDGSGGGVSSFYAEPAYQKGVVPDRLAGGHRVMPDVSADAGALLLIGLTSPSLTNGVYGEIAGGGGTSESAPLIAGLQADAGQAAGQPLGFVNPALYRLAGTAAVRDITAVDPADPPIQAGLDEYGEFDQNYLITVGEDGPPDAPGILSATRGYDDATGIGAVTPGFAGRLAHS